MTGPSNVVESAGSPESADANLARLTAQLQAGENDLAQLRVSLAWLEGEVREREAHSMALSVEVAEREEQLARYSAEVGRLRAQVNLVLSSRSWRITAPLRRMPVPRRGRFLRRALRVLYWLVTFQLVSRLRRRFNRDPAAGDQKQKHTYKLLVESGLFDASFYRDSNTSVAQSGIDPLLHYINVGAAQALDPNPLFDTSFYLESNPEVAGAGINPLEHYVTIGALNGCDPNPLFDTSLYFVDFENRLPTNTNPLKHYMEDPEVARGLRRLMRTGDVRLGWTDYRRQLVQSTFCYTVERKGRGGRETAGHSHFARTLVVIVEDGRLLEPQLIALSFIKESLRVHDLEVFVLLGRGGPLTRQFLAVAPTVVLEENDSRRGEGSRSGALNDLLTTLRARGAESAICYGILIGDVAERLRSRGFRVVTVIHDLPGETFVDGVPALLQQAHANSTHIVVPSELVQKRLTSALCLSPKSAVVQPPAILAPNPFAAEPDFARFQVAKRLNIPTSASIVLGCGRASLLKGFDFFIQLAKLATEPMPNQAVHYVWIGEEDDEFTRLCLEDLADLPLAERIHTPGPQQHPGLFYAAADVFVLTARKDPYPTACLEAMEVGLPVVAFETANGVREVVGQDAGILVPYLDVRAMSVAVERLINDPQLRATLGSCGRKRIDEYFQPRNYVSSLLSLASPSSAAFADRAAITISR